MTSPAKLLRVLCALSSVTSASKPTLKFNRDPAAEHCGPKSYRR
jgi:hypothetical protein